MAAQLMCTEYLLRSESQTESATSEVFSHTIERLPELLDVLFRLPYFVEHPDDPELVDEGFHTWCWTRYVQSPYTVRTIWLLWERGRGIRSIGSFTKPWRSQEVFLSTRFRGLRTFTLAILVHRVEDLPSGLYVLVA